jgi:hypothetical protein
MSFGGKRKTINNGSEAENGGVVMKAILLDKAVLDICNEYFELESTSWKKAKGNCGKCPIKRQCLKVFSLKKMGTMNARNAALNEYVAKLNKEKGNG